MNGKVAMFKETRTYDQGAKRHMHYQTAICSRCGAFENHPIKASRPLPPEPLIKLFQRRGWVMGSTRNHDICPDCIAEAAEAKRKEAEKRSRFAPSPDTPDELPAPTAQIITMTPKEETTMANASIAQITPRQPQREDKRLIILEIENHYLGPDKGYTPGTTDETVAKSLNVPVKWVADLRDEFFGPVINPELVALKTALDAMLARLEAHERDGRDIRSKVMELKERVSKLAGGR